MEIINVIKDNLELSFAIDLIPYKYISSTIRDYSNDINKLESIGSTNIGPR